MKRRHFLASATAFAATAALPSCKSQSNSVLRVYSWADYLDAEVQKRFETEFKCKVEIDTFDSNEAMLAKISAGATGYDVIIPSSYMVKAMVRENRLQALDHSKLPNLKHVDPDYLHRSLDPRMTHSVPYMMACTCLAWRADKVSNPEPSYAMFLRDDLKGRMTLLDDMREVLGAALRSLGFPLNSKDPAQLAQARDVVRTWKSRIAKFDNEQYKSGIASGEFHLVQGYAGDLMQVADEVGEVVVRVPREGSAFSCDDLCIPKDAQSVDLAHRFINFLTAPDVAAKNMESIVFRAPNKDAYALVGEDFRGNVALFPEPEIFARCEAIDDLGDALPLWSKTWDEVKAS